MLNATALAVLVMISGAPAAQGAVQTPEQQLAAAKAAYEKAPDDPDALIW